MKVDSVICSGDRPARVVRCTSGEEANGALVELRSRGVDLADVVVVVRGPEFTAGGPPGPLRFVPEAIAAAAGGAFGAVLAGIWVGVAAALALTLLVAAFRTGRRDPAGPAVRGRRYDLIARGPAVPAVDVALATR